MDNPNTSKPPVSSNVNSEETEEKKFRCQAKKIFMTYAQTGDIEDVDLSALSIILCSRAGGCSQIIIGRERHNDGGWHIHVLMKLLKKPDIRDMRFFDMPTPSHPGTGWGTGHHPNIKVKFDWFEKVEYCMKDMDFFEHGIDLFRNSKGFLKKKADHMAWVEDRRQRQLEWDIEWPMRLPSGKDWDEGKIGFIDRGKVGEKGLGLPSKKCALVLIGPANIGKTAWVENTFADTRVYKPSEGEKAFDDYNGERFLIYDDWIPPIEMFLNASNIYFTRTPCWGNQRYNRRYWPMGQRRIQIILVNPKRWRKAGLYNEEGFMERVEIFLYNMESEKWAHL